MGKKSQITVFIIIGIIVIVLIGMLSYFALNKNKRDIREERPDLIDTAPVKSFVDSCIKNTAKDALLILGKQGRIYPDVYLESKTKKISYYYYKGDGFFQTKISSVEEDVSRYVKENIGQCLDFDSLPYDISENKKSIRVHSRFDSDKMALELEYPLEIIVGNSVAKLSDFSAEVDIRFIPIYELSKEIYIKTKQEPQWLDMEFLFRQDYKIRLLRISEDTLIYEITDDNYGLENEAYLFRFAVKYRM